MTLVINNAQNSNINQFSVCNLINTSHMPHFLAVALLLSD
jgi:hypothetical protein